MSAAARPRAALALLALAGVVTPALVAATPARAATGCDVGLAAAADGGLQVLTLAEAAAFLRLDAEALATAAERGEVPGRLLLREWRFSRAALIAWLAGADAPSACFEPPQATASADTPDPALLPEPSPAERGGPAVADVGLSEPELAGVVGSGGPGAGTGAAVVAQEATEPAPPPSSAPPPAAPADDNGGAPGGETFGEEPELDTARDVALREQAILLQRGELTLEPAFFYARTDTATIEDESFSLEMTARYGIADNVQLVARVPYAFEDSDFLDVDPSGGGFVRRSISDEGFGDVDLSLRYGLLAPGPRTPAVIVSADGSIPTDGSEAFTLGGGVSLTRSLDPTVLFGTLAYAHTFNADSRDPPQREDVINAALGFAFAMNDRLSFGTAVTGSFGLGSEVGGVRLPADETYSLRLSLTSLVSEGFFVEPSVSFQLNGPADAVTFGLSFPYTFQPGAIGG